MTAPFSARRRADEFEALLSRDPTTASSGTGTDRYADLLEVVADLRAVPPATARPEFVASLRDRLMAEADTALVRQPPAPSRLAMPASSRTRQRRIGALLGGAALEGSAATMAVAAQTALPGESLYGVKRGIESAQVRLAPDDALPPRRRSVSALSVPPRRGALRGVMCWLRSLRIALGCRLLRRRSQTMKRVCSLLLCTAVRDPGSELLRGLKEFRGPFTTRWSSVA